jgi:hypothetical protein
MALGSTFGSTESVLSDLRFILGRVTDDRGPPRFFVKLTDEIPARESASASAPLIEMAGTTVYPTTGASQVVISPRQGSAVPDVEASLSENVWDMTTTGLGVGIGAVFGHIPGAVVGGVGMYAWGRLRWAQVQRKRNDL